MSQKEEKAIFINQIEHLYCTLGRKFKTKMLDEICSRWGHNRKYAIRLLKTRLHRPKKRKGPKAKYVAETLLPHLKRIWLTAEQMCSKKLKAALPWWLPHYENTYGKLDDEVRAQLLSISAATIDRLLKPARIKHPRKGISGTRPGILLKNQIPIKTDHWDVTQPGFMEADTVAHCGNTIRGDFVWSLTLTDIHSGWTENRATWNKGATGVVNQIKDIENHLPFLLKGFDCDNGSEFLNHHLLQYFTDRTQVVGFTRSRPNRKNDNAHVEQKNWTHVRQLFSYHRLDNPEVVDLMNDLYKNECCFLQNFFYPCMKLESKQKINSKYKKTYSAPITPYERLLKSADVAEDVKQKLRDIYSNLNPFQLKKSMAKKLDAIFRMVV